MRGRELYRSPVVSDEENAYGISVWEEGRGNAFPTVNVSR